MADAKAAVDELGLERETRDGIAFFSAGSARPARKAAPAYLLPNYDEYLVAYADRTELAGEVPAGMLDGRGNVLFQHTLVIEGRVAGTWKRTLAAKKVAVAVTPFRALDRPEIKAIEEAAARYGEHLGLAPDCSIAPSPTKRARGN